MGIRGPFGRTMALENMGAMSGHYWCPRYIAKLPRYVSLSREERFVLPGTYFGLAAIK